jgi:hypothetical protein
LTDGININVMRIDIAHRIEVKTKLIKDDLDTIKNKNELQNVQNEILNEIKRLEDELKNVR